MSQLLCPTDFNNLLTKLNQFYPDITNDWIPDDFKNCDGIDKLMASFHCTPVTPPLHCTPPNAKQILFNSLCHWLLPNIPQPNQSPHTPHIHNATVGQLDPIIVAIATTFELRLPVDI
eukprot:990280_1